MGQGYSLSSVEKKVVHEVNVVRQSPRRYIRYLSTSRSRIEILCERIYRVSHALTISCLLAKLLTIYDVEAMRANFHGNEYHKENGVILETEEGVYAIDLSGYSFIAMLIVAIIM